VATTDGRTVLRADQRRDDSSRRISSALRRLLLRRSRFRSRLTLQASSSSSLPSASGRVGALCTRTMFSADPRSLIRTKASRRILQSQSANHTITLSLAARAFYLWMRLGPRDDLACSGTRLAIYRSCRLSIVGLGKPHPVGGSLVG
jgi:hypothetical protein